MSLAERHEILLDKIARQPAVSPVYTPTPDELPLAWDLFDAGLLIIRPAGARFTLSAAGAALFVPAERKEAAE